MAYHGPPNAPYVHPLDREYDAFGDPWEDELDYDNNGYPILNEDEEGMTTRQAALLAKMEREHSARLQATRDREVATQAFLARHPGEVRGTVPGVAVDLTAPRATIKLPAPEKWAGATTAFDMSSPEQGRKAKAWLQQYEHYCTRSALHPVETFPSFLKEDASEWYYTLSAHHEQQDTQLSWSTVRTEFERHYTPTDRRTNSQVARQSLLQGECTMSAHSYTFSKYEHAFRNLSRECLGMSDLDKIALLLQGLTPHYKQQCFTKLDGTSWTDYGELVQFCLGVEARATASKTAREKNTPANTSTNRPHNRSSSNSTQDQSNKSYAGSKRRYPFTNTPTGRAAAAATVQKHVAKRNHSQTEDKFVVPDAIPGPLKSLYYVAHQKGWTCPEHKPYSAASFMALMRSDPPRCAQCHLPRPKNGQSGPGVCPHVSNTTGNDRGNKRGRGTNNK